jgi:hypothetical protein
LKKQLCLSNNRREGNGVLPESHLAGLGVVVLEAIGDGMIADLNRRVRDDVSADENARFAGGEVVNEPFVEVLEVVAEVGVTERRVRMHSEPVTERSTFRFELPLLPQNIFERFAAETSTVWRWRQTSSALPGCHAWSARSASSAAWRMLRAWLFTSLVKTSSTKSSIGLTSTWMEKPVQEPPAPTQRTRKGIEIPVPKRKDLMDALHKIVQPIKKP